MYLLSDTPWILEHYLDYFFLRNKNWAQTSAYCKTTVWHIDYFKSTLCYNVYTLQNTPNSSAQTFQKSKRHLKILDTSRVTCRKFHPVNPQTLDITMKNVVTKVILRPRYQQHMCVRLSVLTTVTVRNNTTVWDVKTYSSVHRCQFFR